jgi:DNA-binding PadR family transcriptional regulator
MTESTPLAPAQAAKTLMVLGMLQYGPKHGYELHRIVLAHGSLYADFKKPTLYHLLHRLALQGAVQVRPEAGARGPRGERLVFALAPKGHALFERLLRAALGSYDAGHITFEVASAFLALLPPDEAQELLRRRRTLVRARRAEVLAENELMENQPPNARLAARRLAADHATMLMDAEIVWTDRAIRLLKSLAGPEARPRIRRAVGQ